MATASLSYSSNNAITLDPSSLAQSTTWVAGVESGEIDNTSNLYIDAIVDVKPILWGASTNTVGQQMRVYAWGSDVSLGTTAIGVLDGTASAETVTAETLAALSLARTASALVTTADLTYYIQPFSVAQVLGLPVLPKFWGLFFSHSLTSAVAAGQSGKFQYTGIKLTIA